MNVDQYEREWQIGFTVDAGVDSSFALCISNLPGILDPTRLLTSPNISSAAISQVALLLCGNDSLQTSSFALKYFNAPFDMPQENITATVWYNNEVRVCWRVCTYVHVYCMQYMHGYVHIICMYGL